MDNVVYKVTITDNTGTYTLDEWRALPEWHDLYNRMVGDLKLHRALTRGTEWAAREEQRRRI